MTEHVNILKRPNDTEATIIETPSKKKNTSNFKDRNTIVLNEIRKGREERNILLRDILLDKQNTTPPTQSTDPAIDMFFKSIAATVSTFAPLDKAKIKAEVMSLVSKYEIEQITGQYQNQWPNFSGNQPISDGFNSPLFNSNSADGSLHSHATTSETNSHIFSPEQQNYIPL